MVFKDIERFHNRKKAERNKKLNSIKDQVINAFFTANTPGDIKSKIREAINVNKSYLPVFSLPYKLQSSLEKVDENKYIELLEDENGPYILVDFDFHNIKDNIAGSTFYKQYKRQLKSDYEFKVDGRTEDGYIKIDFYRKL